MHKKWPWDSETSLALRVVLWSWATLAAAVLSPLVAPRWAVFPPGFAFHALITLALLYGSFFLAHGVRSRPRIVMRPQALVRAMFALLLIGIATRLVDRLLLRPVGDFLSAESVRSARVQESNLFSVTAVVASSLAIVLFAFLRTRRDLSRKQAWVAGAMIAVIVLDIVVTASRGITLVLLLLLFGHRLTRRRILLAMPAAIALFGAWFLVRYADLTGQQALTQIILSSSIAGYAYYVPISTEFLHVLDGSWGEWIGFPLVQVNQYAAHGMFEFGEAYRQAPDAAWAPGALLPQVPGLPVETGVSYREGVYYTLPGTLTLSFGKFAPFAAIPCGWFLGRAARRAASLGPAPRAVALLALFGAPFVNTIGGFDLIFYLLGIVAVSMVEVAADSRRGASPSGRGPDAGEPEGRAHRHTSGP